MVALNLLAASLLLAAGSGLGLANAGAAPVSDSSDQPVSSSDVEDRGVNPASSAEAEEEVVEYPVVRDNDPSTMDFTDVVWVFNSSLVLESVSSSVLFNCDGHNYNAFQVQPSSGYVNYSDNGGSSVIHVYSSSAWTNDVYRTVTFKANLPSGSFRTWVLANGSEFRDPTLGEQIVDAIESGLVLIGALGGALVDGFDAVFMDDGALTSVGMFAFILMGVGISVGITKKCFNWVTGRHGM